MQSSITILLLLAFAAANLPFITTRVAGFVKVARKHFGWQALELAALFLLMGGLSGLRLPLLLAQARPVDPFAPTKKHCLGSAFLFRFVAAACVAAGYG